MRRAHRQDRNHREIAAAFEAHGFSVLNLAGIGSGCPDLLVARFGVNLLVEIKDGDASPSKRKLTADEEKFHDNWHGHLEVVETTEDVQRIAKRVREGQKQPPPTKGPAHPTNCLCGFVGTTHNIRAHRQHCETWQSQFGWDDKNQNEGS